MTRSIANNRLAWEDRWTEPSVDQLLKPLNAQRKRQVGLILEELAEWDDIRQEVIWYGPGWNWTIQYKIKATHDLESDILCYIVPKVDSPIVCVPLGDHEIQRLPLKRLNKMIRNGIRVAKCAVSIHWAHWTPSNQTEIAHLIDLLKRKRKAAVTVVVEKPTKAAKAEKSAKAEKAEKPAKANGSSRSKKRTTKK